SDLVNHGRLHGSALVCYRSMWGRGHVSGRGFSYGGTHTGPKWWTMDVYSSTWGRGGCLLGALNKGVPRLSMHMAHTHTHTHRRTCLQCNVSQMNGNINFHQCVGVMCECVCVCVGGMCDCVCVVRSCLVEVCVVRHCVVEVCVVR